MSAYLSLLTLPLFIYTWLLSTRQTDYGTALTLPLSRHCPVLPVLFLPDNFKYLRYNANAARSRNEVQEPYPRYIYHLTNSISNNVGFAGMITAAAAWSIWGSEMFPAEQDPTGGNI